MQANDTTEVIGEEAPSKKLPKVSVCVVTYNQEKYIAQCLQSIVDQETEFDFEIIVGEDCSTDGTREIVRIFAAKYPGKFRVLFHPQNIGAALNYSKTHELAIGEYVAHIDGDDLMLPHKLQRQVNAFEESPSCVIVSHDMLTINFDGSINNRTYKRHKAGVNTLWDLYKTLPFFAHSSKMVKREVDSKVLSLIEKDTLDIELHIAMAEYGGIYHIDDPLGIYRYGSGISVARNNSVNLIFIKATERIFDVAKKKYPRNKNYLRKCYAEKIYEFARQAAVLKNKKETKEFSKKSIRIFFLSITQLLLIVVPSFIIYLISIRAHIRKVISRS